MSVSTDKIELFTRLMERHYGARSASLQSLRIDEGMDECDSGPSVYSVEQAHGPVLWVLRAVRLGDVSENLVSQAAVLSFLEEHRYPATRLVRDLHGSAVVFYDEWQAMVTTYVGGAVPDYSPENLALLGESLGRLHALRVDGAAGGSRHAAASLPGAMVRTPRHVQMAIHSLEAIASALPTELSEVFEEMLSALGELQEYRELPIALIHTDCYPGNARRSQPDEVILLNWAAAGLGPGVIDLGHTLLTCSTALPWAPELEPNTPRLEALIRGYTRHRLLNSIEMDALLSAARFVPAVMAAGAFADAIKGDGGHELWKLWWSRYEAASGVVEIARELFAEAAG